MPEYSDVGEELYRLFTHLPQVWGPALVSDAVKHLKSGLTVGVLSCNRVWLALGVGPSPHSLLTDADHERLAPLVREAVSRLTPNDAQREAEAATRVRKALGFTKPGGA